MATVDIPEDQPIEVTVGAPTFVTGVGGIDGITEARAVELDAQTLAAAKAYADEIDTVPLEYVDDGDADAVAQAKTYTDAALVEATAHAESYTDDAIAGIDFPDTGVPEAVIDAKDQAVREHADAGDQSIRELIANLPAPVTNWSGIADKPTTFTPAAHTHTVSQITDMPATPTWGTLGGKPTTFPPSAHQHAASDITSGVFAPARLGTGTASASNFLRGDGSWAVPASGGSTAAVSFTTGAVNTSTQYGNAFTTVMYGAAPATNVGGGVWDLLAGTWRVPVTGIYLITAGLRFPDGTTRSGTSQGVHTSNADGAWGAWQALGGTNNSVDQRDVFQYTRVARFTEGDLLRQYIYRVVAPASGLSSQGTYWSAVLVSAG